MKFRRSGRREVAGVAGLLAALVCAAEPSQAAGQTEAGASIAPAVPAAIGAADGVVALVTRGRSEQLRLLVAAPADRIDIAALEQFGGGWENGHRWWTVEDTAAANRLPGQPLQPDLLAGPIVAPSRPGFWRLESESGSIVSVVTAHPAELQEGGRLNGYNIGIYPTAGTDRVDAYRPPEAFIEVTQANRDFLVSRHLTLGQFLTKDQAEVWPKYLALDLRLIDKLELVLAELNAMGIRADRLHIMSGFRTPQYNGPGGDGRASLSRHMWGDAADVWVDSDANGLMDDLNGDTLIDLDDAAVIMRAVERVEARHPELVGGAGTYPTSPGHGPYIHIDARGELARW